MLWIKQVTLPVFQFIFNSTDLSLSFRNLGIRVAATIIYIFAALFSCNTALLAYLGISSLSVYYIVQGAIGFAHGVSCIMNAVVEVMAICFCRKKSQRIEYPLFNEFCGWSLEAFTTPFKPVYRYMIYDANDFEMLPHSRHVMVSSQIDTRSRPRPEHWCNTMGRNITCNGCLGNYCRNPLARKSKKDRSWQVPNKQVAAATSDHCCGLSV